MVVDCAKPDWRMTSSKICGTLSIAHPARTTVFGFHW